MTATSVFQAVSNGIFLVFVAGIPLYGWIKKVKVYEAFLLGAQEGFAITIKIVPYVVAIIVAIGMFRASGAFDLLAQWLAPVLAWLGMPVDVLPLVLVRPFSGGAANGVMAEVMQTHGGDSFPARLAATIMGSTETTFYVLAVYFGAVNILRARHAVLAGLSADLAGVIAALLICHWFFK